MWNNMKIGLENFKNFKKYWNYKLYILNDYKTIQKPNNETLINSHTIIMNTNKHNVV